MERISIGIFSCVLLGGCASAPYIPPPSAAHYQSQLSVWVGKNVREIPADWGAPAVSTAAATTDGLKRVHWSNRPRSGCTTTAVTDSSGTISAWQLDGASCMSEYTDPEIRAMQAKRIQLQAFARTLKRGTSIRLSFYLNAVDDSSHPADQPLNCYFVRYGGLVQEITVREQPIPPHGYIFARDSRVFDMKYIQDIQAH